MNDIVIALTPFVATVPDITPEMRSEARRKAKENIAFEYTEPKRSDYADAQISKYPPIIVKNTTIALVVLFLTSFIPSAVHIYTAVTNGAVGITDIILGVCAVLGAELAIMVMVIGSQVFYADDKNMKRLFYIPIVLTLGIVYVGNFTAIFKTGVEARILDYLLAVTPPTVVLFISYIGKALLIDLLQVSYSGEMKYQEELTKYHNVVNNPELAPNFLDVYYRQLKVMLERAVTTGAGATERKNRLSLLSPEEKQVFWMMLVNRTMQNERAEFYHIELPKEAYSGHVMASGKPAPTLPMTAGRGDGVSNVSNLTKLDNEPRQMDDLDKTDSRQVVKRPSKAWDKAMKYLANNPHDMELTTRELEEKIGVSRSTIANVLVELRNQTD